MTSYQDKSVITIRAILFILLAANILAFTASFASALQADNSDESKILYMHLYSNRYDITSMEDLPPPPREWQCIATVSIVSGYPFYFDIPCHYEPEMRMEGKISRNGRHVETEFTIDVADVGPSYRHVQNTPIELDTLQEFGDADFRFSISESRKPHSSSFDIDDDTLYTPVMTRQESSGFTIAGTNRSETLRQIQTINGLTIQELEDLMRPGNSDRRSSTLGFLGPDESLIEVLVADNDFITSQGLTHRELAIPLLQIFRLAFRNREPDPQTGELIHIVEFEHGNINWRVEITQTDGFQYSPFNDDTKSGTDFLITNLDSDVTLRIAKLVPIMIERYGFYEGRGTPYRVEPQRIIDLLELTTVNSAHE
jgi:hypothetical protein